MAVIYGSYDAQCKILRRGQAIIQPLLKVEAVFAINRRPPGSLAVKRSNCCEKPTGQRTGEEYNQLINLGLKFYCHFVVFLRCFFLG